MRKNVSRRTVSRRKPKKKSFFSAKLRTFAISVLLVALVFGIVYHYRDGLAYYLSFKTDKILKNKAEAKRIADIRNHQVLEKHTGRMVGIDVSEYQGKIDWTAVDNVEDEFPVTFVFIRATAGNDRPDNYFKKNWAGAKKNNIIRGAYHYYRPNENSLEQAALFIKTVKLKKGDLPPVLDIERLPKNQSLDSLKVGLKRWLNKVELYYGVKPIIYTGEKYYADFLHEEFKDYPFWIANYNFFVEEMKDNWLFWQFTEKASIDGINGTVDVNIFNGTDKEMRYLTVGN